MHHGSVSEYLISFVSKILSEGKTWKLECSSAEDMEEWLKQIKNNVAGRGHRQPCSSAANPFGGAAAASKNPFGAGPKVPASSSNPFAAATQPKKPAPPNPFGASAPGARLVGGPGESAPVSPAELAATKQTKAISGQNGHRKQRPPCRDGSGAWVREDGRGHRQSCGARLVSGPGESAPVSPAELAAAKATL
jgi:hypothetical protein